MKLKLIKRDHQTRAELDGVIVGSIFAHNEPPPDIKSPEFSFVPTVAGQDLGFKKAHRPSVNSFNKWKGFVGIIAHWIRTWMYASEKTRGIARTLQVMASGALDHTFDWRYGTDTMMRQDNGTLAATKARPLRRLLKKLNLPLDAAFLDLGSGKGRALLIAAEHGFGRIIGVEHDYDLYKIAWYNAGRWTSKKQSPAHISIYHADAGEFLIRPEYRIFFLFNPFHGAVMDRVLCNIKNSLVQFPRTIWLIYNTPVHDNSVLKTGVFSVRPFELGGTVFNVYTNFSTGY
jgi:hypothetical protein